MLEYRILARYHVLALLDDLFMKTTIAAFVAILVAVFSAIESLVHILVLLLVIDFVLDFWVAWREDRICSLGVSKTIVKVLLYAIACLVVGLAARAISLSIGASCGIDIWFVCLVCINETLSCLANLSTLGFPVPTWVIDKLKAFHEDPTKARLS